MALKLLPEVRFDAHILVIQWIGLRPDHVVDRRVFVYIRQFDGIGRIRIEFMEFEIWEGLSRA